MRLLFIISALCYSYLGLANTNTVVVDERSEIYDLFRKALIITDSNNVYTIDQLLNAQNSLEFSSTDGHIQIPSLNKSYWLKVSVTNKLNFNLVTFKKHVNTQLADLFVVKNGEVVKKESLISTEKYADDDRFKHSVIYTDLELQKGETLDLYLHIKGVQINNIPWLVSTEEVFISQLHRNDLFYGLVYGLFFIIIVYNLMLFIRLRENDYLYYVLNMLFLGLLLFNFQGHPYEFILNGNQNIKFYSSDVLAGLAGIAHCLFAMTFLHYKKYPKWIAIVFYVFIAKYSLDIILRLIGVADNLYPFSGAGLTAVFSDLFIIGFGVYVAIKGFIPAVLFVAARVSLVISVFVIASYSMSSTEYSNITYNSLHIGASLEMLLFAFAISYKIRLLKDEKVKAQKEKQEYIQNQNIVLEKKVVERTTELKKEKEKSDDLLLNILPEAIANELKLNGHIEAKHYEGVSVLFSDFVNFTQVAQKVKADDLVKELNILFKEFDQIIQNNGLEKIKTIGDAYMAAGGVPRQQVAKQVAINTVRAALQMQDVVERIGKYDNSILKSMRLGVHTGDVVAGVVGSKKFQYDIWGETVNLAARMENSGEAKMVNISESTYNLVKDEFECKPRGEIHAKNIGDVKMYFAFEKK